jgi:hypothetical protein
MSAAWPRPIRNPVDCSDGADQSPSRSLPDSMTSVLAGPEVASEPAKGVGSTGQRRSLRAAAIAIAIIALLPVIAVLLQRWGRPYFPVSDSAILDLRIRDVWAFSSNTPLTGVYSRFGWNHPGPLMYYLLAAFSGVTGGQAWATLVGNALLQGVAIVWIARLSWKSGGLRWMLPWMAVVTLSYVASSPAILQDVWNPNVSFPFFVLFLLQSWLVGLGHSQHLIGLAFVATFLVQTDVGFALPILIVGGWALVRLTISEHTSGRTPWHWALWRGPLIVIAVLWFVPVVLDTALHFPGNLVHIVQFFAGLDRGPEPSALGLHGALGYLATEFKWIPPWLGGHDPIHVLTGLTSQSSAAWLVLPVVLIGTAWGLARWRRQSELRLMAELLAVTLFAGVITLTEVRGPPIAYLFYWRINIGAACAVLGLYIVVDVLYGARIVAMRLFSSVLVLAIGIASIGFARSVAAASGPIGAMEPVTASIVKQLDADGQPRRKVLVNAIGPALGGLAAGIVDQLAREGAHVFVPPAWGFLFGSGRTAQPSQVHEVWFVIEDSMVYSAWSLEPGARVLAVSHPLPSGDQADLVALQRDVSRLLQAEGRSYEVADLSSPYVGIELAHVPGITSRELATLAKFNLQVYRHTCLCAVISFSPKHVPSKYPLGEINKDRMGPRR